MKITIPIFCLFISSLIGVNAQDAPTGDSTTSTPLPPLSTVDDVVTFANDVARKIMDGRAEGAEVNYNLINTYVPQLSEVDHKTLITAFSQLPLVVNIASDDDRNSRLKHFLLLGAVTKYSTQADIPTLLDSNTYDTLRVISDKHLQNDSHVTAFLVTKLQQFQTSPPLDTNGPTFMTLFLANLSYAPSVNTALAENMTKAANDSTAPLSYLTQLADAPGRTANKSDNIQDILPSLILNILSQETAGPGTPIGPDYTRGLIEFLLRNHPARRFTANPAFAAKVIPYLKSKPDRDTPLALANLGDPDAFAQIIQDIAGFNSNPGSSSDGTAGQTPTNSNSTQTVDKWVLKDFLNSIIYSGHGDKIAAVEEHYKDAVFKDGVWTLTAPGSSPAVPTVTTIAPPPKTPATPAPVTAPVTTQLVAGQPWTNSLGVKLVPAGTDGVLFSVWDVRVKDFRAFVDSTGYDATQGASSANGKPQSHNWEDPGFKQTDNEPAVFVSWNDATAFCQWLTKKEQAAGLLTAAQEYRLPTDAEWSKAAGLSEDPSGTPAEKGNRITDLYPWGTQWPPPAGVGNYAEHLSHDGYANTSPVGAFPANQFGLYDMGGNVWNWCEDKFDNNNDKGVLRGGSYAADQSEHILLACRADHPRSERNRLFGFRVVLVVSP